MSPRANGGGRLRGRHDDWRRGGCHAARARSGGGRSLPGDPRRGAHPLCTDDRSRHE
jgi:hypothetical protein